MTWRSWGACVLLAMTGVARAVTDEAEVAAYLEALHRNQFSDLAVEYLRLLERDPKAPADLKKAIDYEIGAALMQLAEVADPETERRAHDEATARFRKYLGVDAAGPRALDSRNQMAYILLKRGQRSLLASEAESDKARAEARRLEARQNFDKARQDFADALAAYVQVGADDPNKSGRLREGYIQARMNRALVEYYTARAYPPADAKRKSAYAAAEKQFGEIVSETSRTTVTVAAIFAKIYQAKATLESGNPGTAVDILEEALVNEVLTRGKNATEFRGLFARVRHELSVALNAAGRHQEVVSSPVYSAQQWIEKNLAASRTAEGFGVQLELAKAYLALAKKEKEESPLRKRYFGSAQRYLTAVAKSTSPYTREAFRLRTDNAAEMKVNAAPTNFEEAVEAAALLRDEDNWKDAADLYASAAAMTPTGANAADRLADAKYWIVFCRYRAADLGAAAEAAQRLVAEHPRAKRTPFGAEFGVLALYQLQRSAPATDRAARTKALFDFATLVEGQYSDVTAADVAKRMRGYALMAAAKYADAAAAFAGVRKTSPNFGESQFRFAQCRLRALDAEMRKPADKRVGVTELQTEIENAYKTGSTAQREELLRPGPTGDKPDPNTVVIPPLLAETELSWAEFYLRLANPTKAAALVEPLVAMLKAGDRPDIPGGVQTRILVVGLEVANFQKDYAKADALVEQLVKAKGGDPAAVTTSLIRVGQGLEQQYKAVKDSGQDDRAAGALDLLKRFLKRVADRPNQDYRGNRYVAEANFNLGLFADAAEQYAKLIEAHKGEVKEVAAKSKAGEVTYLRMRRLAALRQAGSFEKALAECDALIAEVAPPGQRVPYPLVQQMEKGRILRDWGAKESAKLGAALAQWGAVQRVLGTIRRKPVEFYEVRYEIATCQALQGKKSDALQTLQQTVALNPEVGSPELKAKFDAMLKSLGGQ